MKLNAPQHDAPRKFIETPAHTAIFAAIRAAVQNIIVEAVAGSGKTSTTIECMNLIPDTQTVLSLAFNKRIVEELVTRVPSHVDVKTLNALGHNALVTHLKAQGINVKLDGDKVRRISRDKMSASEFAAIGSRVVKLVRLAKSSGMSTVGKTMPHIWEELAAHHDVMQDVAVPENIPRIYEWSKDVLRMSCEMTGVIDFDDQLLMTYALDCPMERYDWVFCDESQDLNSLQHELVAKALGFDGTGRGTGRLVAVGDPHQAIYGFRGADADSMDNLKNRFGCVSLPLHVSYRCPQDVVAFAQRYVSHIQAHEGAPKGTVIYDAKPLHEVKLEIGDMVICRMTAPVVRGAYACIKQGVPAVVLGRDIGAGLLTLIRNLRPASLDDLTAKIDRWEQVEMGKAIQKQDEAKQAAVEDKAECVHIFIDMAADLGDLTAKIESMFSDARAETVVTFCTIHKSKGLEAERVFILDFHRMPSKWAKQPWQKQQEINIIYVAITRAKKHLQLVLSGGDPATTVTAERKPEPAAPPVESIPEEKWIPVTGNTYPVREKLKAMGRAVIAYNLPHAPKVWSVHPAFKDEAQAIVSGPAASNVIHFRRK